MPEKRMTEKQKRFCDEYLACLKPKEAAIKAGYSQNCAAEIGYENLTKPHLKAYIDQRLAEKEEKLIAKQDEILQYFTSLGRGELTDTFVTNDGDVLYVPAAIRDRTKAFELLGRVYGIFNDRLNISEPVPVVLSGGDDLEE